MAHKPTVTILCIKDKSCAWVYNAVVQYANVELVIVEESVSKMTLIRNRIKRLGFISVFGQVLFLSLIVPILSLQSKKRGKEIKTQYDFKDDQIPQSITRKVHSVNADETRKLLQENVTDFVVVVGTRIISNKTLSASQSNFVNIHAGITPNYRGVHGGYWALYNDDAKNFGVTLHYVDQGIDTGDIISQKKTAPKNRDNYATYPLLQTGEGLKLLRTFIEGKKSIDSVVDQQQNDSKLWYHPTLWQYLSAYLSRGIK